MERFKIYGYINPSMPSEKKVLITNSEAIGPAATLDENFSLGQNDRSSLSFSIYEYLPDGRRNPFIDLLLPECIVGIDLLDRRPIHDTQETQYEGLFIKYKIKSRSPEIKQNNLLYRVQCEDYASSVYSKEAQGLSIDKTGTIQELAEEILGVSRKNTVYENLNIDLSRDFVFLEREGFNSTGSYLNYHAETMNLFDWSIKPFKRFIVSEKMKPGIKYDLKFDLINSSYRANSTGQLQPLKLTLRVIQKDITLQNEIDVDSIAIEDISPGVPKNIVISFTLNNDENAKSVEYIDVMLSPFPSGNWPSGVLYDVSTANFSIVKNKDHLEELDASDPLHLNNLNSLGVFKEYGIGYQDTKMTFTIDNSNLYNAIIELAKLFEAEVRFDYEDNAFYFISTKERKFRGYRLDPRINLSSISRPESSDEFASILHVRGSDDVNSIIPPVPKEWRDYFLKAVKNNFIGEENFEFYEKGVSDYEKIAENYILPLIEDVDDYFIRADEILKFARQMDKIPNFDGTLYDFRYFLDISMISEEDYEELIDLFYNEIRKINIKTNVLSYQYYTIYSDYSQIQTRMAYYILGIVNEMKFQFNSAFRLTDPSLRPYTQAWVSLKNQIDASESQEQDFIDNLNALLGYDSRGYININEQRNMQKGFLFYVFNLFGYKSFSDNGLTLLIKENQIAINKKMEEQQEIITRITDLESQISSPTISDFEKESLSVELSGQRRRLEQTYTFLGYSETDVLTYMGTLEIEKMFLNKLYNDFLASGEDFGDIIPLYDTLYNKEYPENILVKKEKMLEILYSKFEAFAIEGVYENSDEIDSYGLLNQALNAFVYFSKPKIEFSVSSIEIGAIERYEFMPLISVGEKILLTGKNLYRTYHREEETEYLIVTDFRMNLRDPSSLSMSVTQDDETERLVKELLKNINLVKIEPYKQKSNLVVPIPQELNDLFLPYKFLDKTQYSEDLSKIISNNISLLGGMFVKEPNPVSRAVERHNISAM